MRLRARPTRPAFTLLELLLVISIIALLATISVSAVFRLQEGQRESNTNTHLNKIHMVLDQQRSAANAESKNYKMPDSLKSFWTADASSSPNIPRAKALHTKLYMRREFPQTFDEVRLATATITDAAVKNAYASKPSYLAVIGAVSGSKDDESAALLYLALTQSRGGATTNDDICPTQSIDIGGKSFKVFIDEWKRPIGLRRWFRDAEQANVANELANPPFVAAGASFKDMDDPEGKMGPSFAAAWPQRNNVRNWFVTALPEVSDPFDGYNRVPFAVSSGKDETFGTADDLYSFRIKGTGKGN